jgi:hypothetical protein
MSKSGTILKLPNNLQNYRLKRDKNPSKLQWETED